MWRGPIWPFALGVALVPAFMVLLDGAFRWWSVSQALLAAVGAAGLLAVHPSAALAAAVFAVAYFVQRWVTNRASLRTDIPALALVGVARSSSRCPRSGLPWPTAGTAPPTTGRPCRLRRRGTR